MASCQKSTERVTAAFFFLRERDYNNFSSNTEEMLLNPRPIQSYYVEMDFIRQLIIVSLNLLSYKQIGVTYII